MQGCARLNLNRNSVSSQDVGCGLCLSLSHEGLKELAVVGSGWKEMTRKGKPQCFRPETPSGQCQVVPPEEGSRTEGFLQEISSSLCVPFSQAFLPLCRKKNTKVGSPGSLPTGVSTSAPILIATYHPEADEFLPAMGASSPCALASPTPLVGTRQAWLFELALSALLCHFCSALFLPLLVSHFNSHPTVLFFFFFRLKLLGPL